MLLPKSSLSLLTKVPTDSLVMNNLTQTLKTKLIKKYKLLRKKLLRVYGVYPSIGLAWNQISDRPYNCCIIEGKFYINPTYSAALGSPVVFHRETCLSALDEVHMVPRYTTILFEANSIVGNEFVRVSRVLEGFSAFVVQHEVDHLRGVPIWRKSDVDD